MSDSLSHRALSAMRRSDRKAAQLLGVTITRDPLALTPHSIHMRQKRFGSGNKLVPGSLSPDGRQSESVPVPARHPHAFAWDVPDPFAFTSFDSTETLRDDLVQDQIACARQYESIGPLQPCDDDDDTCDEDEDKESYDSSDGDYNDADAEDEDEDNESDSSDDPQDVDKSNMIALPKLLHTVPLRFIGPFSPPSSPVSRPPTPLFYPSDDESELDLDDLCGGDNTQWANLAQTYNDLTEAEERDARKAKRDAHRSRLKALAILGPEASVAL